MIKIVQTDLIMSSIKAIKRREQRKSTPKPNIPKETPKANDTILKDLSCVLSKFVTKYDNTILHEYQQEFIKYIDTSNVNKLYELKDTYHPRLNTYFHTLGESQNDEWFNQFINPFMKYRLECMAKSH